MKRAPALFFIPSLSYSKMFFLEHVSYHEQKETHTPRAFNDDIYVNNQKPKNQTQIKKSSTKLMKIIFSYFI